MSKTKTTKRLSWDEIVDKTSKIVFRLYSGKSAGTGFLVGLATDLKTNDKYATIATAWHVLSGLPSTKDDLKIVTDKKVVVANSESDFVGFYPLGESKYDTGLILLRFRNNIFEHTDLAPLFPADMMLAKGAPAGWLGYPGITEPELCFFQGHVSGYLHDPPTYLIDGVAINGVSGGPVFDELGNIFGIVSAYIPNIINATLTLPGLMSVVPINAIRYWMEDRLGARVIRRS